MNAKTLDILILESLLESEGEPLSACHLSRTWGEDKTRVKGWLIRFEKLGAVRKLVGLSNRRPWIDRAGYTAVPGVAREYIAKHDGQAR